MGHTHTKVNTHTLMRTHIHACLVHAQIGKHTHNKCSAPLKPRLQAAEAELSATTEELARTKEQLQVAQEQVSLLQPKADTLDSTLVDLRTAQVCMCV
jgi:peptidoglycan hydrolase CwlO-like protein